MPQSDPPTPEFENIQSAAQYDCWVRSKVEAAMADSRPSVPHDQVMAELKALVATYGRGPL